MCPQNLTGVLKGFKGNSQETSRAGICTNRRGLRLTARFFRLETEQSRMLLRELKEHSTVMFCRVCGFRVRVWKSCKTCRSSGYGYGSLTELMEVPGSRIA